MFSGLLPRAARVDPGAEVFDGDAWDDTIYEKQHIQPINARPDLWEAMKALPEREYRAVMLFYWGNMTQAQIAAEIGVDQKTISRDLESAKKLIRECLNGNPHTTTSMRGKEIRLSARIRNGWHSTRLS
jgi:DNA-directed RNA polymerase specialized sigma24 family protein